MGSGSGNKEVEQILAFWRPKINYLISKYGGLARDKELLNNELQQKVWKCINDYDSKRGVKFKTFVYRCLINHIQVFIRTEQRKKHIFLSAASISLEQDIPVGIPSNSCLYSKNSSMLTYEDMVKDERSEFAEGISLTLELDEIKALLPDICPQILDLMMAGYTFTEIAEELDEDRVFIKGMWDQVIAPLVKEELF